MARAPRALLALALALLASALVAVPASGERRGRDPRLLRGRRAERPLLARRAREGARPAALGPRRVHRLPGRDPQRASSPSAKQAQGPRRAAATVDTASPPSADEQRRLGTTRPGSPDRSTIGGRGITPGASGAPFKTAGLGTDLPPLVLAVLVALAGAHAPGRRARDPASRAGLRTSWRLAAAAPHLARFTKG